MAFALIEAEMEKFAEHERAAQRADARTPEQNERAAAAAKATAKEAEQEALRAKKASEEADRRR